MNFNDYLNQQVLSDQEFIAALKACNYSDEGQVKKLISSTHTPAHLNKSVLEKHYVAEGGCYDYFTNFFGTEEFPDGVGQDYFRESYFAPRIGVDFSRFIRTMQICDPAAADECNTYYEDLPEGGRGTLPPVEMYKWGVKTPRQCVANMRHIRDFQEWAGRLVKGWHSADEQIMNMFYMFAALRMSGHKVVLQGQRDNADNGVYPVPSMDPKNPFNMFLHNYMDPMFPQVIDADLIVPLEMQYLEQLARHWTHSRMGNAIGTNNRGDLLFEMWYPEDWFRQYALQNPEYFTAIKETMPAKLLSGYSLMNGADSAQREIIGNWSMRVMPCLPRFAESTEGGLVPIDDFINEQVDVGQRPVFAGRQWMNAPFLLAMMPSPSGGKIIHRPDITKSAEGWPIKPILGRGGWVIRNDFDKDCNYELNQPYSERRYELGFRMDDPDAMLSIIFRNTVFRIKAANECLWAPNAKVAPIAHSNFQLAPGTNERRAPQHVTAKDLDEAVYIECDAHMCGTGDGLMHRLKFTRKPEQANYLPFSNCACGDTLKAVVVNEDGDTREIDVVVVETAAQYGNWVDSILWVQLEEALEAGEAIKYVYCEEDVNEDENATPFTLGENEFLVDTCTEVSNDDVRFLINEAFPENSDSILITYYNSLGEVIGTATGTEGAANGARDLITVAGTGGAALECNADAEYTTITAVFE